MPTEYWQIRIFLKLVVSFFGMHYTSSRSSFRADEGATIGLGFSVTYIALWVVMLLQGLLILALLQRLEKLRQLIERGGSLGTRLPVGSSAPGFSGTDWFGKQTSLTDLDGRAGVVLFLSPSCSVCKGLAESIGSFADDLPPIIAFCLGEREACALFSM